MRTVIDVDKSLLEAAQEKLGSSTANETVHAALQAIVNRDETGAIEAFEFWRTEGSPDLLNPEIMKRAWRPRD